MLSLMVVLLCLCALLGLLAFAALREEGRHRAPGRLAARAPTRLPGRVTRP